MKILKYSFSFLVFVVVLCAAFAMAKTINPAADGYVRGTAEMPGNSTVWLEYDVNKTGDSIAQKIKNTSTFTTITNPCTDCKIETVLKRKLSNGDWDSVGTVYTYQGTTASFDKQDVSYLPGTYTLTFKRDNFSLVTTYTGFDWKVK